MAEFGFTEAHELLRREASDFAQRGLLPDAGERAKMNRIPQELIQKIAEAGYTGITAPASYGGQALDMMSLGIVLEEFAKVDIAAPHVVLVPAQVYAVLESGTEEQRQQWIPRIVRGQVMPSLCITEPDTGSDAAAIKMRALRSGEAYFLNGEKTSVTRGMQSDLLLVWAKTDPEARARGVSCFLVSADTPGVSRSPSPHMGWRPMQTASIVFDDVEVPVSSRVGDEGRGFYMIMDRFDVLRVLLALEVLGMAQASVDETIAYVKQRTAFGKPIGKYEGVSFKIAEALTLLDAARLLCYRALWMRDNGIRHSKESAMCKWWVPLVSVKVIHDCLPLFGHVGYSEEYPIAQRLRDAIGYEMADGTAEIQKLVIVREVLGRDFLPY
jgi:cyclohexanecarboxyl-CoA dehydrogenase